MSPLRVESSSSPKWAGWLCIAFFGFCTLASHRDGFAVWFLFLGFVALGVFLLLIIGPLEMNAQFIRHTSPLLGCHQMNWNEVERLEIAPREGGDIVLHGHGKRLSIPGTNLWSGPQKEEALAFFQTQI